MRSFRKTLTIRMALDRTDRVRSITEVKARRDRKDRQSNLRRFHRIRSFSTGVSVRD
jgi:hypothetical protein